MNIKTLIASAAVVLGAGAAGATTPNADKTGDGVVTTYGTMSGKPFVGVKLATGKTVIVKDAEALEFQMLDDVSVKADEKTGRLDVELRAGAKEFVPIVACAHEGGNLPEARKLMLVYSSRLQKEMLAKDGCWTRLNADGKGGYTNGGLILRGEGTNIYDVYRGDKSLGVQVMRATSNWTIPEGSIASK